MLGHEMSRQFVFGKSSVSFELVSICPTHDYFDDFSQYITFTFEMLSFRWGFVNNFDLNDYYLTSNFQRKIMKTDNCLRDNLNIKWISLDEFIQNALLNLKRFIALSYSVIYIFCYES